MISPLFLLSLLYGEVFHCLFKVLAALEITADKVCLPVHNFPSAYRQKKEIASLIIFLDINCCRCIQPFTPASYLYL